MLEDPLVLATYGLFLATVLLVVATAIPAYQRWREIGREKIAAGARVVPDMNILKSRLEGGSQKILPLVSIARGDTEEWDERLHEELHMVGDVIGDSYAVSLTFANELYIVRHLLTQARNEVRTIKASYKNSGEGGHDERRDATERVGRLYKAAEITIGAAEALLPKASRLVDGQTFWDRFRTVAESREAQGAKDLVDERQKISSRRSRGK